MAQLAEADQLIRAKQPAEAIAKTLDPVIAHYEASYANSPKKIYCSRSPEEALMYMMASAVAKQSALALGSTWADAYHMKSYALIELGAVVAARDALLKAVALSPQNALYLGELGYTYQADKSWELALETFKRAEQAAHLSPKDQRISEETRALRGEGYVLVELGQLDEAAVAYRKALTLNPDDRQSKAELGYIDSLKAKRAAADAPAAR
ncbi:MAG TPA: tetratricopeptide repeat protein [Burkholderiaceae bacterium]